MAFASPNSAQPASSVSTVVYVALPTGRLKWVPSITAALKMIASYPWEQQLKMDWVEFQEEEWEKDVPF